MKPIWKILLILFVIGCASILIGLSVKYTAHRVLPGSPLYDPIEALWSAGPFPDSPEKTAVITILKDMVPSGSPLNMVRNHLKENFKRSAVKEKDLSHPDSVVFYVSPIQTMGGIGMSRILIIYHVEKGRLWSIDVRGDAVAL